MTVEIVNGADGGPLLKLYPEAGSAEDAAFVSQFGAGLPIPVVLTRVTAEGEGERLDIRHADGD